MHGSDGAAFNPYIKKSETLWFFNDQLCRAMPLVYAQTVQHKGLPGLRCGIPIDHRHSVVIVCDTDAHSFDQVPTARRCLHVVQKVLPVSFLFFRQQRTMSGFFLSETEILNIWNIWNSLILWNVSFQRQNAASQKYLKYKGRNRSLSKKCSRLKEICERFRLNGILVKGKTNINMTY